MIIPAPDDVAFKLLGFPVYWYGITMALAILTALLSANYLFNKINSDEKKDVIIEFAPLIIVMGILGARLYFCLLNSHYYLLHPLEILDIREGGLSIHGAIIGGILALYIAAKKHQVKFLSVLDAMGCSTILGQSVGRWGNYFNSEAYGLPVLSQKWGLYIPPARRISEYYHYSLFHPAFLYESVLDLFAFFVLLFILLKFGQKYKGVTFFSYLILYSVIRFFIERIRLDSALNVGSVPIAQLISVLLFVIGIAGLIFILIKNKKQTI